MSEKKIKLKTFEEKYNDTCQLLTKLREIYLYEEETNITVISETWGNVCNILNPPKLSDQELMKVFLGQIRDEILDCVYDSLGNDNVGQVNKVFNKYLNKK